MKRLFTLLCFLSFLGLVSSCSTFELLYAILTMEGVHEPGNPYSLNITQAKCLGTFLAEYTPSSEPVIIDGKQVRIPIKEAFVEQVVHSQIIQLVIHWDDKVQLGKNYSDSIEIGDMDFVHFHKKNNAISYEILNKRGDTNLPDSMPQYIVEVTPIQTESGKKLKRDTLQTLWLVKKPQ